MFKYNYIQARQVFYLSFLFFFFFKGRAWDTIDNIVYLNLHGCGFAGLGSAGGCDPPLTDFVYISSIGDVCLCVAQGL